MKKNAATSRQASKRRNGSFRGRTAARRWTGSVRVSQSQSTASPVDTTPKTTNGARQPPARCASGTAVAAAIAEPMVIPVV